MLLPAWVAGLVPKVPGAVSQRGLAGGSRDSDNL
jgi:hypothetical protein